MKFRELILSNLFSFNAVAIIIGILGSLASVSTLIFNVNATVTVGWLLMVIFVFTTLTIVLLKIIFDLQKSSEDEIRIRPIQTLFEKGLIVLKTSSHLEFNQVLTVFQRQGDIETLAAHGFIQNIQKGGIATLKIIKTYDQAVNFNHLDRLIVKTIVPIDVLSGG